MMMYCYLHVIVIQKSMMYILIYAPIDIADDQSAILRITDLLLPALIFFMLLSLLVSHFLQMYLCHKSIFPTLQYALMRKKGTFDGTENP